MKKNIIHLLLYSAFTLGITGCHTVETDNRNPDFPEFKAGETITVMDGLKVYAESVTTTNLHNVIIHGYDDDQLSFTAKAESADYNITETKIEFTLSNGTLEAKDQNGIKKAINFVTYPLILPKK